MKKTLAILLALLCALSISLTACTDDKEPLDDDDDDDIEQVDDDTKETNDNASNNDESSDNGNNNNINNDNTDWVEKNDIVYAGVKLNLRETASVNSNLGKTVPFGTQLNRIASNGTWDKVKIEGDNNVYYVKTIYVSLTNSNYTFEPLAGAKAITLSTTTANNVMFYTSPFMIEGTNAFDNVMQSSGIKSSHLSSGYTLKVVATNSNWAKVELTGTVTISSSNKVTYENEVFYIRALAFTRGDIVGASDLFGSGNGGNGGGGLG